MSRKSKLNIINDILEQKNVCKDVRKIILNKVRKNFDEECLMRKYLESSTFSVFFAKETKKCIIIREDHFDPKQESHVKANLQKCRRTHMLTWNLETDEIVSGQWLLNKKLKMQRNMLSPDGKYFAFTMSFPKGPYKEYIGNGKGIDVLTVISKPPYFSGITVFRHDVCPIYGDLYSRMMGTNWIDDKTLLLKSKASIEKGKKPKELKIMVLNVPKKVNQFDIKKHNPKPYRLGTDCNFDKFKRQIHLINGRLYADGKQIYDFAQDTFQYIPPPNGYFDV